MECMTTSPTVSVVMSVYNGEQYLSDAIESILRQTFTDFEFLIIDDGSTDTSPAILKEYYAADARVRVIRKENEGLTKALNLGLRESLGEFVARFDADDISLPKRFERQVDAFRLDPTLIMVGSEVELILGDGTCLGPRGHPSEHGEIRKRLLLGDGGALTHSAVMIRRSALESVAGYAEAFIVAQDLDLFLRLSEIGKIKNLPETLLLWRQQKKSINRTCSDLWITMKRLAILNTINRLGAAEFVDALFYRPEAMWPIEDPVGLATFAKDNGRLRSAAKLYIEGMKRAGNRRGAIKGLLSLMLERLTSL
jgi:glycosyltransferase involved in cell wall biosynthesis